MADLSDVEIALVTQVANALFPGVTYVPGTATASVPAGMPIKVYRGWPLEAQLDIDLLQDMAHVSIFPSPGMSRNSTRWFRQSVDLPAPIPTFTVALEQGASAATVTFGGVPTVGEVVGVGFADQGFTHRLAATDTPAEVAALFAAHMPLASASGAVLTLATTLPVTAMVLADVTSSLETRRQEQIFRVSLWAPTPQSRDRIASIVDAGLSNVRTMQLADGSYTCCLQSRGTHVDDAPSKERLWVRHCNYAVEYPTVIVQTFPRVIFSGGHIIELTVSQPYGVQLIPQVDLSGVSVVAEAGSVTTTN